MIQAAEYVSIDMFIASIRIQVNEHTITEPDVRMELDELYLKIEHSLLANVIS
ncbi:MAG: hypothetical protein ACTSVI_10615 [Promethearchaeota archaeon]